MLTPWNIGPSFRCSLLTPRTGCIPTHTHLHPQRHDTLDVEHILHTHIWSLSGCTLLSLILRACVQTQGFLSSPLGALKFSLHGNRGRKREGKMLTS